MEIQLYHTQIQCAFAFLLYAYAIRSKTLQKASNFRSNHFTFCNLYICVSYQVEIKMVKGIYLSKALTCMIFFRYKQKMLFIKETDTFGHIVV